MSAIRRMFDVRSPMRDGVELSSDLWLPAERGRYPLILFRTPYLKSSPPLPAVPGFSKLAEFFVTRGYAFAVQDVRGRGDSGGDYGYYFQEGRDGYDTIEWMALQSWCNGRVGAFGGSYSGLSQWLAAREQPPHLVCIAAASSPGDFMNELPSVGGAFLHNRLWWANYVAGRIVQGSVREEEWAAIFKHRPLMTADEVMGRRLPLYREWLERDTLDEYWKGLRLTEQDYQRIDLPALHVTGWFDSAQAGAMYHWQGMTRHSPAARHQYLIVGPWDHGQTFCGGALKMGEMEFPADSIVDFQAACLEFFEHYLKRSTADLARPRAKLYTTGCNQWRSFDAYPLPGAALTRLHLDSSGQANSVSGDGCLTRTPAIEAAPDRYTFDPQNPVPLDPFVPGSVYGADRRALEQRDDVLVYTGETLSSTLQVIGRVEVELYAASDALDTDFTASLIDVYPDGRAVVLGARVVGIMRARYRKSLERTELLTPGQVERYRIDLGHIAHAFLPGHRLRVEISSSAAPMYNPNQNTGNPVATDTEWRTAQQAVYHDARYPSALVLPVVAH